MSHTIRISDEMYSRLQQHARAFVDTPASVIGMLLDSYEKNENKGTAHSRGEDGEANQPEPNYGKPARRSSARARTVIINGKQFDHSTVVELYRKVLAFLADSGQIEQLKPHIPVATSNKRYVLAREPYHQGGNKFRRAVEYRGLYMETHKNYKNAYNSLRRILDFIGMDLVVIR